MDASGPSSSRLSGLLSRRLLLRVLRNLRRPRAIHREADTAPERFHLALDLVAAGDQVFENRLVPVQACVRHELHPVPARRFVGRLREPVPDRHVRLARHEIWTLRGGARTLDRLVDQHPVGEIELEVLLIEIEVYRL